MLADCGNIRGGLQDISNQLGLKRIGTQHQAGSDALLTGMAFFRIKQASMTCHEYVVLLFSALVTETITELHIFIWYKHFFRDVSGTPGRKINIAAEFTDCRRRRRILFVDTRLSLSWLTVSKRSLNDALNEPLVHKKIQKMSFNSKNSENQSL